MNCTLAYLWFQFEFGWIIPLVQASTKLDMLFAVLRIPKLCQTVLIYTFISENINSTRKFTQNCDGKDVWKFKKLLQTQLITCIISELIISSNQRSPRFYHFLVLFSFAINIPWLRIYMAFHSEKVNIQRCGENLNTSWLLQSLHLF